MDVSVGGTKPAHSKNKAFFQARETKHIGRCPHAHWYLRILQPVLAPIRYGHQILEANIVKVDSTRENISKGGYGTHAEPMEYIGPKVTGTAK